MDSSIRSYDFRQPVRLSSDQVKDIRRRLGGTDRSLSSHYSAELQTPVDVTLHALQAVTYLVAETECGDPGLIAQLQSGFSTLLVQSPRILMDGVIENLTGGSRTTSLPPRPLTDLDRLILRQMLEEVGAELMSVFAPQQEAPIVTGLEPEVRLLPRVYAPDDTLLRVRYRFQFRELTEVMTWYVPLALALGSEPRSKVFAVSSHASDDRMQEFNGLRVRMTAELGTVPLTVGGLTRLHAGQVLALQGDAILKVGRKARFRIRPGRVGDRMGAEIVAVLTEEENGP